MLVKYTITCEIEQFINCQKYLFSKGYSWKDAQNRIVLNPNLNKGIIYFQLWDNNMITHDHGMHINDEYWAYEYKSKKIIEYKTILRKEKLNRIND